jgi:phenylacetate-CoA ligase
VIEMDEPTQKRDPIAELAARDRWTREELLDHQQRSLAELRRFVRERSPFYRRLHAGLEERPLSELPILTKPMLMDHFDELVTDPAIKLRDLEAHLKAFGTGHDFLGKYIASATSGTTGNRGLFLLDRPEWEAAEGASRFRSPVWGGFVEITKAPRLAIVVSRAPLHQSAQTSSDLEAEHADAAVLNLDAMAPLSELVARLNAYQPNFLGTYPSIARPLAEEQLAGRLKIAPKMVLLGSEVLTTEARKRMNLAWGPVTHNLYGATETGDIATECARHDGLHVFEDFLVIENVDAEGRPVPDGELGDRLLVTTLFRRVQPLIRYELNDRVRLSTRTCSCGLPYRMVEAIEGRNESSVVVPRADTGEDFEVDTLVFLQTLDVIPAAQWQVIHDRSSIEVLIVRPSAEFQPASIVERLQSEFERLGARVPEVKVSVVDAVIRGATAKAPMFVKR